MSEGQDIAIYADWEGLQGPTRMGQLSVAPSRGKEVFSFEYDHAWLDSEHVVQLDPSLGLYGGRQFPASERWNFGLFLDSAPDRWGRVLMQRREARRARIEKREPRRLHESDYLLGVNDAHRMGALRFQVDGKFVDEHHEMAAPPWTSLRELEQACRELESERSVSDSRIDKWLRMLIAPGGSLGGARPKAGVLDETGRLWIAKFPSRSDEEDVGAWESVIHTLATCAKVAVPVGRVDQFSSSHHTFLSRRFDRTDAGARRHFASAMTLLQRKDGDDAAIGASYLELAELLIQLGARTNEDLEQLWRRIVFFICVSNTDDHLRNHGFLLRSNGWTLAPAYDMNPDPHGDGLKLNISETDNSQDLDLAMEQARFYRVDKARAEQIIDEVLRAVRGWRDVATALGISRSSQDRMRDAFRVAEES